MPTSKFLIKKVKFITLTKTFEKIVKKKKFTKVN